MYSLGFLIYKNKKLNQTENGIWIFWIDHFPFVVGKISTLVYRKEIDRFTQNKKYWHNILKTSFFTHFWPPFPQEFWTLFFPKIFGCHFFYIHLTAWKRIEKTNGLFLIKIGDRNAVDQANNCGMIGYPLSGNS